MADNNTISVSMLNTFLTVWGLVAPLFVGVVSDLWNKKNNIEERNYQRSLFLEDQKKTREQEMINNQLHMRKDRLLETKMVIINYLRVSHENFHSNIEFISCPTDNNERKMELLDIFNIKNRELNSSYNELYLIVPTEDVARYSTALLKHLSENKKIELDKDGVISIAAKYAKLREDLLIATRKYSQEEEQNLINIAQLI